MRSARVLPILVLFLATSGAIRVGIGIAGAQAAAGAEVEAVEVCGPQVPEVLAAFAAREAKIEADSIALEQRRAELELTRAELAEQLRLIQAAEATLKETYALSESAAETDITQLVRVYENMKPRDAAALFSEMAPEFAAGFVARMQPESAALILAGLEAEKSHAISVVLAGRNAGVPRD